MRENLDMYFINILEGSYVNMYRFLGLDLNNEYVYNILKAINKHINITPRKYKIYLELCYELEDSIHEYTYFTVNDNYLYDKYADIYNHMLQKIIQYKISEL